MSAAVTEAIETAKDVLVGHEVGTSITADSKRSFERFSVSDDSGRYMTPEGFVSALTASNPDEDFRKIPREQYVILFKAAGEFTSSPSRPAR